MKLTEDQRKIADEILSGRHDKMILAGPGGSGKTHLVKYIVNSYPGEVHLTATTHAAKTLLGAGARTIHSFLKMSMSLNQASRSFKEAEESAETEFDPNRTDGLLIVDEYSMLTRQMQKVIEKYHEGPILLVGDLMQLPPVGGKPVKEKKYKRFELTKNLRSECERLSEQVSYVRERAELPPEIEEVEWSDFVKDEETDKIILCYRNEDVDRFNERRDEVDFKYWRNHKNLRKCIDDVCYYTDITNGAFFEIEAWDVPYERWEWSAYPYGLYMPRVSNFEEWGVSRVRLSGVEYPFIEAFTSRDEYYECAESLWERFEEVKKEACKRLNLKYKKSAFRKTKDILDLRDSSGMIAEFNYIWSRIIGFQQTVALLTPTIALTVHKAQGAGFNHVYIYGDESMSHKMLYTAASRARKKIFVLV